MAQEKPRHITQAMPEHHHPDDAQWIDRNLLMLDTEQRERVAEAYSNVFMDAYNNEHLPHRKDGRARFSANIRLLTYIKKRFSVFNK